MLLRGPQVGGNNITAAERGKIEDSLELLINKYFKTEKSFRQLKAIAKQMDPIQSDTLALLQSPADYYSRKLSKDFTFEGGWELAAGSQVKNEDQASGSQ